MPYVTGDGLLVFDVDFTFPAWMDDGECGQADPDLFFPEQGGSAREAKAICTRCPVRSECLAWSVEKDIQFGVWGGKSERERRTLRVTRKKAEGKVAPRCRNKHLRTEENSFRDGNGRLRCRDCMAAHEERRRLMKGPGSGTGNWTREPTREKAWAA